MVLKDKRNYGLMQFETGFRESQISSLEPFKNFDGRFDPSSTALTKRSQTGVQVFSFEVLTYKNTSTDSE